MNEEKQKKRPRALLAVCIIAGAICVFALALVFHNFVFVIKNVNVEGTDKSDPESVVAAGGIETGKPIYSIDKSVIAKRIMQKNPYVESVSIKRDLPSDLNITVTESKAACYAAVADEFFILSDELRVLEYTKDRERAENIASFRLVLSDISRMILGEKVSFFSGSGHEYISEVIKAVAASKIRENIRLVSVENKFGIFAECTGKYRIDFGSYEDIALKIEVAYAIIESGKLTEGVPAKIDVSDPSEAQVISDKGLIFISELQ